MLLKYLSAWDECWGKGIDSQSDSNVIDDIGVANPFQIPKSRIKSANKLKLWNSCGFHRFSLNVLDQGLVWLCYSLYLSATVASPPSETRPRVLEDQDSLDDAFHDFHWFLMMTLWFNCSPVVFPTNLKVSVPIPPLSFHALFVTPRTKFQRILWLYIFSSVFLDNAKHIFHAG